MILFDFCLDAVKLPDLITSMDMEDHKVKALLSLLHCFLE